ncbi:hypothetical protein EDB81DRAFT_765474 [Dactylonectria macrodidyma]|uniref:Uncharacterized protein n=1 Tax=Dactylonectria macrodidyma TaxID=307937 RepID=A0A9P9DSP3_9HYPO|nr:hypothetical protein EDB81DRAFT_765474 [Dactylonectria macrodidyma]
MPYAEGRDDPSLLLLRIMACQSHFSCLDLVLWVKAMLQGYYNCYQSILAIQGLYGLSMCTSKWSILWNLKRVFAVRMFSICAWIIIVIQPTWMIMALLIGLLICRLVQKN